MEEDGGLGQPTLPEKPANPGQGRVRRVAVDVRGCYNYRNNTMKTKLRKIGNSYGIILPKEALHVLQVKEGDVLYLTDAAEASLRITPGRPGFEEKAAVARDLMRRYRNALRELAK